MSEVFGEAYSAIYDAMYVDKDYERETDVVEDCFRRYSKGEPRRILDLGCGTGRHAEALARRGYEVLGVDRSVQMLNYARDHLVSAGLQVELREGDLRSFRAASGFDVVLMLFAVLGYQIENEDVAAALLTAREHLEPGGLLVFDVWYGPTVLTEGPEQRFREIETPSGTLLKASTATLQPDRHIAEVDMRLWLLKGGDLVGATHEAHTMRYFFPLELENLLQQAAFRLELLAPFPEVDRPLASKPWNVVCVAAAV